MSTPTTISASARERGPGYALLGGAAITLVAMVVGGALFGWIFLASRGPSAAELLPADVQLYAAVAPNVGGVVEVQQLQQVMREGLGIAEPERLLPAVEDLLGVPLGEGNVGTWLGSEIIVAVRGVEPGLLQSGDASAALLNEAEVIILLGSKNDPQAQAFLERHRTAREARSETITASEQSGALIYTQTGGSPSLVSAFGLIEHYVVFSNSRAALEQLATASEVTSARLKQAPGFTQFSSELATARSGAIFTDGSPESEAARAALREVLSKI